MSKGGFEVRRKGFEHERELARRLFKEGFAVLRAPASGAKVFRLIYPDVVAIYKGKVLVFEVKAYSSLRVVYIDARRYEGLMTFAERAGGEAFLAFKLIGSGEWRLVPFTKLEKTKSGVYHCGIGQLEIAEKLEDLIRRVKGGQGHALLGRTPT
jgi:Holliday junction resolvase